MFDCPSESRRGLSIDPLTGLPDRRGLAAWGERHVGLRHVSVYVVVPTGPAGPEQSLVAAASILRASVRETDLVARHADDALALVALGVNATLAEQIRRRLETELAVRDGRSATDIPLTVSIGMASHVDQGPASLDNLLRRADALCRARVLAKTG